jgi:hypothetical protein
MQHATRNACKVSTRRAGTRKRQRDMFDKTAVHCSAELPSLPNQPKADGALSLTKAHETQQARRSHFGQHHFSSGSQDRKEESSAGWNPAGRRNSRAASRAPSCKYKPGGHGAKVQTHTTSTKTPDANKETQHIDRQDWMLHSGPSSEPPHHEGLLYLWHRTSCGAHYSKTATFQNTHIGLLYRVAARHW